MGKITVLIADDHILFREGTRKILEQEPDLEVVAEAGDGRRQCDWLPVLSLMLPTSFLSVFM